MELSPGVSAAQRGLTAPGVHGAGVPPPLKTGRGLAAALLLLMGGLAWVESRSELAAAVRQGRPWICWLEWQGPDAARAPMRHLAVYQPKRRTVDLVYFPSPGDKDQDELADLLLGAGRPIHLLHNGAFSGEAPPLAAKRSLESRHQGLSFWSGLLTAARPAAGATPPGLFERALWALELHRLPRHAIRPAWLPEPGVLGAGGRRAWLGRLLAGGAAPAAGKQPVTVEVLNASERKGIAFKATKILRSQGADVVGYGNEPGPSGSGARTIVYDRTGRFENAAWVRERLGCPDAEAATWLDAARLVDVSVVLAGDCF